MKVELEKWNRMCPQKGTIDSINADIIQKICILISEGERKATYIGNKYLISDMRAISSGESCH